MYQFVVPPENVNPPAVVAPAPVSPGPDLSGYRKSLEVQPVLAQHGFGVAHRSDRLQRGTVSFRQALRETLPTGWTVYTKPGVTLDLPVVVTGAMTKERWTQALKEEIQQAGLHGALWWDQQTLTLWTPPPAPMALSQTVTKLSPALNGYRKANLSASMPAEPSASPADKPAAKPAVSDAADHTVQDTTIPLRGAGLRPAGVPPAGSLRGAKTPSAGPTNLTVQSVFMLTKGQLILTELQQWAKQSGWTVVWQVPEDWMVPNTTTFNGDFQQAVSQVIEALAANGANIHAVFHTANDTVVIQGAGGGN